MEIQLTKQLKFKFDWGFEQNGIYYYGTIQLPDDPRGKVRIEWDSDVPDNWEDIEDKIIDMANDEVSKF